MQKIESRHRPYKLFTKINSKWVTGVNVKCKPKTSRRENLDDHGCGSDFLNTILTAWSVKEIIDKVDVIKIKNFSVKDNI